jgi:hypothetical protein
MGNLRSKLSFANVTSVVALIVALGGTAYAAATIGSAEIIDNSVASVDLRNGDVRTADVRDDGLTGADVDELSLGIVRRAAQANNANTLDGEDFSSLRVQTVINALGPLPRESTFQTHGGDVLISFSGSGFRGTGTSLKEGYIGMDLLIDGTREGLSDVYVNERNSHRAFVSGYQTVRSLPAGVHTLGLQERYAVDCNTAGETQKTYCTDTDSNDVFQVSVIEVPRALD